MEGTKGEEGAVTVGTMGTISLLMTRELDQISYVSNQQVSSTIKPRNSASSGSTTPKRPQPRKSFEASTSRSNNIINHINPGIGPKTKHSHQIPMLGSHNLPLDSSPVTKKKDKKKKSKIVEVVDIKCGYVDKAWATPITNSLKKLGFSKLSESIT